MFPDKVLNMGVLVGLDFLNLCLSSQLCFLQAVAQFDFKVSLHLPQLLLVRVSLDSGFSR